MTQASSRDASHGKPRVLVPLLEGFEEIEAITLIDVLRRGQVDVVIGGETPGPVRGAHDILVHAEVALDEVKASELAMVVLPGGAGASAKLADHPRVQKLLASVSDQGGYTCAMCAAPMALAAANLHIGKKVTSHPLFADYVKGAAEYSESRVVVDGAIVTSRSPGTAMEFALTLVGLLRGRQVESELEASMLVQRATVAEHHRE